MFLPAFLCTGDLPGPAPGPLPGAVFYPTSQHYITKLLTCQHIFLIFYDFVDFLPGQALK